MKKILVIGDTIIDKYIYLETLKISDEAPVITHNINKTSYNLGGGSNVGRNIKTLGCECDYLGLKNFDNDKLIQSLFKESKIKSFLFTCKNSVPIKTRIISRNQQISRFDTKNEIYISPKTWNKIYNFINKNIYKYDFVVFSKYFDGFLEPSFVNYVANKCKLNNIPTILDNRQSNSLDYHNIDFLKLNFKEFQNLICKKIDNNNETISMNLKEIYNKANYKNIIVTRAEKDVILINKQKEIHYFPIEKSEVVDVSGAGDTFVATIACFYNNTSNIETIKLAIKASKISISKLGTSVTYKHELFEDEKQTTLEKFLDIKRKQNKKIVLTNGVFDILHTGHIKLLKESKLKGDILIVGLNSDESVKKIKGKFRPINNQEDRKEILKSIKYVDYVEIFNEKNAINLIKITKPDIYVKGGDYTLETLPEKNVLKNAEVIFVNRNDNKSTTNMINKINSFIKN